MPDSCPICSHPNSTSVAANERAKICCPRCGTFIIARDAKEDFPALQPQHPDAEHILSYFIRHRQNSQEPFFVTNSVIQEVIKTIKLPTISERGDNLIIALGTLDCDPGTQIQIDPLENQSVVGTKTYGGVVYVIKELEKLELVEGGWHSWVEPGGSVVVGHLFKGILTFKGWERFAQLQKSSRRGTRAFIAMEFGNPELNDLLENHLRPTVKLTGYDLYKLDDEPRAGLIDDRLRVEINKARFLLAELTHRNLGAYWEAGYAEGLDIPVIYLCKRDVFENEETRPHFDTNHHLTITWDPETIGEDMQQLKATIRFSIPEAKQAD